MANSVQTADFQSLVGQGVSLIDFWGDGCPPCKMIAPVIDALAADYDGKANVAKVNVYEETELAAQFEVMAIPTIIVFKDGQEVQRFKGMVNRAELGKAIDAQL